MREREKILSPASALNILCGLVSLLRSWLKEVVTTTIPILMMIRSGSDKMHLSDWYADPDWSNRSELFRKSF